MEPQENAILPATVNIVTKQGNEFQVNQKKVTRNHNTLNNTEADQSKNKSINNFLLITLNFEL